MNTHQPSVREVSNRYVAECSCGWVSKSMRITLDSAERAAEQHARMSPPHKRVCHKAKFATEQEAWDVVVRAKIARSLRGKRQRREQRAYQCPICVTAWHVTSLPSPTRSTA